MRLETSDWQAEAFKSLVRAAFEFNSVLKETLMYTLEIVVLFRCKFAHSRKYSFSDILKVTIFTMEPKGQDQVKFEKI